MYNLQRRVTINPATHLDTPLTAALVEQRPILTTHLEQVDGERHHHQGSVTRAPGNTRQHQRNGKSRQIHRESANSQRNGKFRQHQINHERNVKELIMHCSRDRAWSGIVLPQDYSASAITFDISPTPQQ